MRPRLTPAWVLLAYLISGVCFILALRGCRARTSSQRGNRAGMIGMAIAVVTTLAVHEVAEPWPKSSSPSPSAAGSACHRPARSR